MVLLQGYHLKDYDQTLSSCSRRPMRRSSGQVQAAGLHYRYALIDDVAAKVIRSEGNNLGLQELRRRRDERPHRRRLRPCP